MENMPHAAGSDKVRAGISNINRTALFVYSMNELCYERPSQLMCTCDIFGLEFLLLWSECECHSVMFYILHYIMSGIIDWSPLAFIVDCLKKNLTFTLHLWFSCVLEFKLTFPPLQWKHSTDQTIYRYHFMLITLFPITPLRANLLFAMSKVHLVGLWQTGKVTVGLGGVTNAATRQNVWQLARKPVEGKAPRL